MDSSTLIAGLLFGAIGTGYLVYAKNQHHAIALLSGCLLIGLPYMVATGWLLILLCLAAMALPFIFRM